MSLYQEITAAGIETDHHESDLYVRDTPEARRIIEAQEHSYTTFRDDNDDAWLDVPFAYAPFWEKKGLSS